MVNAQTLHRRAARVLPAVIGTSGVIPEPTREEDLAALLFPLRRKSSGTVMFRLSYETRQAMGDKPLAYLRNATRAREGLGRSRPPFAYGPWKSASIPLPGPGQMASGAVAPLRVFFTRKTDGKAWMVVVPAEGWLLYAWHD